MPTPRRDPTVQEINTAFSDMSTEKQALVLESLAQIHRILKRERSRTQDIGPSVTSTDQIKTMPTPTEWLTAPEETLQKRLAANALPEDHEA